MWTIRCILATVAVISIVMMTMTADKVAMYIPKRNICTTKVVPLMALYGMLVDLVICNFITILYCRRLLVFVLRLNTGFLGSASNTNATHHAADEMYLKIMTKSTVLTGVASLSTQLNYVLCWLIGRPVLWGALDTMVNSWCLILIFDMYSNIFSLYQFCCGCCEKLMCYQCIMCYSCHCCCRVKMDIADHPRPEIRRISQQSRTVDITDDNARGDENGSTNPVTSNPSQDSDVELQIAETQHVREPSTTRVQESTCHGQTDDGDAIVRTKPMERDINRVNSAVEVNKEADDHG